MPVTISIQDAAAIASTLLLALILLFGEGLVSRIVRTPRLIVRATASTDPQIAKFPAIVRMDIRTGRTIVETPSSRLEGITVTIAQRPRTKPVNVGDCDVTFVGLNNGAAVVQPVRREHETGHMWLGDAKPGLVSLTTDPMQFQFNRDQFDEAAIGNKQVLVDFWARANGRWVKRAFILGLGEGELGVRMVKLRKARLILAFLKRIVPHKDS